MSTYLDMGDTLDLLSQEETDALVRSLIGNTDYCVHNLSYDQIQAFLELPDIASLLIQLTSTNLTISRLNEILHTLIREVVAHTKHWKEDE
jgi:hypothetical protein